VEPLNFSFSFGFSLTYLVIWDGRVDRAGGVGHVGRQRLLREVHRGVQGASRVDEAREVLQVRRYSAGQDDAGGVTNSVARGSGMGESSG